MFKRTAIFPLLFLLHLFITTSVFAVNISIPNVQSIPDAQQCQGVTVNVPINIDYSEALGGFQITVEFDPTVLELAAENAVIAGDVTPTPTWTIVPVTSTPGTIIVGAYDSSLAGPTTLNGSIINLSFVSLPNQEIETSLTISDIIMTDIYGKEIFLSDTTGKRIPVTSLEPGAVHISKWDSDDDNMGDGCDNDDDNDGLPDYEEGIDGTDPLNPDTDGDGVDDLNDVFPLDGTETIDSDGKEIRITDDPLRQAEPGISGNYIVWHDERAGAFNYIYDISKGGPEMPITEDVMNEEYHDISGNRLVWNTGFPYYKLNVYDISSGQSQTVRSDLHVNDAYAISGDLVVWEDESSIQIFDISSFLEFSVSLNPTSFQEIAISSNHIVWTGVNDSGILNLFMYNMITSEIRQVTNNDANSYSFYSFISGKYIVWLHMSMLEENIYSYNIDTNGPMMPITASDSVNYPNISGNRIVWSEERDGNRDIYMYDISLGNEIQISNSGSAYQSSIFRNRIVWADLRSGNSDIYLYAGDGIGDNSDKCPYVYDPDQTDEDNDGIGNACDICPTDENNSCDQDSDGDNMPDSFELYYGVDNATDDADNDGLSNLQEFQTGTDPRKADTDNDGINDGTDNCPVYPTVRIAGVNYSSLQSAYNKAVDGATIQSQDVSLNGGININRNINVTIDSGYNCDYSNHSGETTISGDMVVNDGTLIIDSGTLVIE